MLLELSGAVAIAGDADGRPMVTAALPIALPKSVPRFGLATARRATALAAARGGPDGEAAARGVTDPAGRPALGRDYALIPETGGGYRLEDASA